MFRTKNTRTREVAIIKKGIGTIWRKLFYPTDNKVELEKKELELTKVAKLEESTLDEKYPFLYDSKTRLECLDELFDLVAVTTKVTKYDLNGISLEEWTITEEEKKKALAEMYERVKRGLELVAEEEEGEKALIEHLNEEAAKTE